MAASSGRFHWARVTSRHDVGGGLTRMTIEAEREIISTYQSPGQYVEVCAGRESGFFVLANEPGDPQWTLVMRSGGGASDVLLDAGPGVALEITGAIGSGFPLREARGRPLIVALGGSGIAAGPPIVARRVVDGDATRTQVLVGIRTSDELPMRGDLEAWISAGVDVLVCVSQDHRSIAGIPYEHGYLQDVLRTSAAVARAPESRIFAVGTTSMVQALKNAAPALGITPEHIYLNH